MTIEAHLIEDTRPSLVCACGGGAMRLVRVNPRLGAFPELRTYRCERCGAVETVEVVRRIAPAGESARDPAR